jgi:hypothetical protein
VLSEVEQDVDETIADFARRCQGVRMIAIAPDGSISAPESIERASHAASQTIQTSAQIPLGICLDD